MRFLLLSVIILFSHFIIAQEFEVDPSALQAIYTTSNDGKIILGEENNNYPHGPTMTFKNEEGSTYLSVDEVDGLQFHLLNSKTRTQLKTDGLYLYSVDGQNNNPIKYFDISQEYGFRAFDQNGNTTVQIQGDLSGKGRVSTNELEIMGGSDLSEYFDVSSTTDDIRPGMLVSISADSDELQLTSSAYDKKVVGIVSGANGIETGLMMGQHGTIAHGDTPIALVGRAYVYANTENGPIQRGDQLTSSSTDGYAMRVKKSKKARGAVIGKALTSLEDGEGFVLVLINLQ